MRVGMLSSMDNRLLTFIASMVGFIVTGLFYTLLSFSYIHDTFASRANMQDRDAMLASLEARVNRVESRLSSDIREINKKLDYIAEKVK